MAAGSLIDRERSRPAELPSTQRCVLFRTIRTILNDTRQSIKPAPNARDGAVIPPGPGPNAAGRALSQWRLPRDPARRRPLRLRSTESDDCVLRRSDEKEHGRIRVVEESVVHRKSPVDVLLGFFDRADESLLREIHPDALH